MPAGEMDHCGTPRNVKEPHGAPTGAHYPLKSAYLSRFFSFEPLVSPLPHPFHITKRSGGFETPSIAGGRCIWGDEKGHRAQWATAEPVGASRNHEQWEAMQNGPPRQLAAPNGT